MSGLSAIGEAWDAVHANSLTREAFGVVASAAWLAAVEWAAYRIARHDEDRAIRLAPAMTLAAGLWMVFAFRRVAYFPSAVAVCVAGLVAIGHFGGRLRRETSGARATRVYDERRQFHWISAGLALLFWWQGWMFNMIGPLLGFAAGCAAERVAHARWGRRRLRAVEGKSVEGVAAYALACLIVQFAVYWNWSQIPGIQHEARVLMWSIASTAAGTVAFLYAPRDRAAWLVPACGAFALYIYVVA
ncbi:MAG: hypothetical protein KJ042_11155 [Deltaproteobacteria bacterium]|nr:hypothetical protein [Deltaproteobacteria bacterium]